MRCDEMSIYVCICLFGYVRVCYLLYSQEEIVWV